MAQRGVNVETSPGMLLMFLPCLGVEVLPTQDISAASKGLTSEGNRDREIDLHAVSLLFGCLFLVFLKAEIPIPSHENSTRLEIHEAVPRVALPARISMKMR